MNDPALMKLLNFTEADLYANRLGRISDSQRTRLAKRESSQKSCSATMGVILLIIALVGLGGAVAFGIAMYRNSLIATIGFGLGFGCIWPVVWGGMGISSIRRSFAKLVIQLKKAEGPVNIVKSIRESYNSSTHTHSTYEVHELHVGGRTFQVTKELPDLMMQGDVYAVYFAENNLKEAPDILSVELLANANQGYMAAPAVMDDAEVVEFLKKGNLMKAIQAYRAVHNSSLEEARTKVLEMQSRLGY